MICRLWMFLIFIFGSKLGTGQIGFNESLEPLFAVDTICDLKAVEALRAKSEFHSHNCIFIRRSSENPDETGKLLLLDTNCWIEYEMPGLFWMNQFAEPLGFTKDKQFFLASCQYGNFTRGQEVKNEDLFIVDIRNRTFTSFTQYYYDFQWTFDDSTGQEIDHWNVYNANIIIEGNRVMVISNTFENFEVKDDVSRISGEDGVYEIKDGVLHKTHYYNRTLRSMTPIRYAGKIAHGMTLKEVQSIYPNGYLLEVPRNKYGDDQSDEVTGFEIWDNNELLYFVDTQGEVDKEFITDIFIIKQIDFGKIRYNSTIKSILRIYPKCELKIDLISDWEYMYISELGATLCFKTNEGNRIGKYKFDEVSRDMVYVSLLRKDAVVDFIRLDRP
jgi:hypothetical protein